MIRHPSALCVSVSSLVVGMLSLVSAVAVAQPAGGPDGFGHTWRAVPVSWDDVSGGTRARSENGSEDDGYDCVPLPFAFDYYGVAQSEVCIGWNGLLSFSRTAPGDFSPDRAPSPTDPDGLIAVYWTDLDLRSGGGEVRYATLGSGASERFVVEWKDACHFSNVCRVRVTAQAALFASGEFELRVSSAGSDGDNVLVGFEDATGADGLTIGYGVLSLADVAWRVSLDPAVDAGGPYVGVEGAEVTLSATGWGRGLAFAWDLDEDGLFDDAQGASPTWTASGGPATVSAAVQVTDVDGRTATATATVTISNAPPAVTEVMADDPGPAQGQVVTFTGTASDPGGDALSWTWDFGDGVVEAGGATITHTYQTPGVWVVVATASDGAETAEGMIEVSVFNVPPTLTDLTGDLAVSEGEAFEVVGAAVDPGVPMAALMWRWELGDGSPDVVGVGIDGISHGYSRSGVYTISVTVEDADGGTDTRTLTVTVADVAPTILEVTGDVEGDEGEPFAFEVVAVDAGGDALSYMWQLGDGVPVETGADPRVELYFEDDGAFEVTVKVLDTDGSSVSASFTVTVRNVAPHIVLLDGPIELDEGEPARFQGQASDAAGAADPLTWRWEFGDGTAVTEGEDLRSVRHAFPDEDLNTVTLTVTDDEGAEDVRTLAVTVRNVAPRITSSPVATASLGQTLQYAVTVIDPGQDRISYRLAEGPHGMAFSGAVLTWTPELYQLIEGPFMVTVVVDDGDGGEAQQTWELELAWDDVDGDGAPDDCERVYGLDPTDPTDGGADGDMDGISSADECFMGQDPTVYNGPTAPTLLRPEDGKRVASRTPELVVINANDPDVDPLTYEFEVQDGLGASVASADGLPEGAGATTAWTVALELDDNTVYAWRARARDAHIAGPWSEVWSFLVDEVNEPPTAPVPLSPTGSTELTRPVLRVDPGVDPEGDGVTHRFEVYTDANLTRRLTAGAVEGVEWPLDVVLTEDTRYWWRAQAEDTNGATSPFSPAVTFLVNTTNQLPLAPEILVPEDGGNVETVEVNAQWRQAVDPDGDGLVYDVQVAASADFRQLVFEALELPAGQDATVSERLEGLEDGEFYWMRVRALDPFGAGPFATVRFRVGPDNMPPSAPVILGPRNGERVEAGLVDLVFGLAEDDFDAVLTYRATVYADESLTRQVFTQSANLPTSQGQARIGWAAPLMAANYWWTVTVADSTGLQTTEGPQPFVVVITTNRAPEPPTPVSPIDFARVDPEAVRLTVANAYDPDGDTLTYAFRVFSEPTLSQRLQATTGVPEGPDGQTSVSIEPLDDVEDGTPLYWIAVATDDQGLQSRSSEAGIFEVHRVPTLELGPGRQVVEGSACGCRQAAAARPRGGAVLVALGLLALAALAGLCRRN